MTIPLLPIVIIPSAIAFSMGIVALYLLVARKVMPRRVPPATLGFQTPLEQFNTWPGGRTKIAFEGDKMVRTRVKTDPVSGIAFKTREVR